MRNWLSDAQTLFDAARPTLPSTGQVGGESIPLSWEMEVLGDRVFARPVGYPTETAGSPDQSIHDILTNAGIVNREVGRLAEPVVPFLPPGWEEVVEPTYPAADFLPESNRGYASDVWEWRRGYIQKLLVL